MTIFAGLRVKVRNTTHGDAAEMIPTAVGHMMCLPIDTADPRFRRGLLIAGVVVLPVARVAWPTLTEISVLSSQTFSVPLANELVTWPSTVICWPPPSASSGI